MPASWEMVFSTDKTHTYTQRQTHTTFRPQQRRWVPMWVLCSRACFLISFILPLSLSVCLSLSLRRSEVCKIIHSSSLQNLRSLSDTHTHMCSSRQQFCPLFYQKKLRDLVAKRPNASLVFLISISHSFHAIYFVGFAREATITPHCLFTMAALSYQQG